MNWRHIAGWSLVLAPVAQIGGWTLMRLGGNDGVEPQTTVAHTVWLIGFVMLAVVCVELYRRVDSLGLGRVVARVSLAVALLSVAASVVEMLVDLYVNLTTDTHAEVTALNDRIHAVPGVEEILYGFGTQLVYLAVLALTVQLTVLRRIGVGTLAFVLATLVLFVAYELLDDVIATAARQAIMPFAVACMWLALAPLGRRQLKRAPGRSAVATP